MKFVFSQNNFINKIILTILKIELTMEICILFHLGSSIFFTNHSYYYWLSFPFYCKSQKIYYFYGFLIMINIVNFSRFTTMYLETEYKFIQETFTQDFISNSKFPLQKLQIFSILQYYQFARYSKLFNQVKCEIHKILSTLISLSHINLF